MQLPNLLEDLIDACVMESNPMYPTDYPVLSKGTEKILVFLVAEIRHGRFDPANDRTLSSFQEVHEALGLQRDDNNWEKSLNAQGPYCCLFRIRLSEDEGQ